MCTKDQDQGVDCPGLPGCRTCSLGEMLVLSGAQFWSHSLAFARLLVCSVGTCSEDRCCGGWGLTCNWASYVKAFKRFGYVDFYFSALVTQLAVDPRNHNFSGAVIHEPAQRNALCVIKQLCPIGWEGMDSSPLSVDIPASVRKAFFAPRPSKGWGERMGEYAGETAR